MSTPAIDRGVFDRMYDSADDPWGFTTSSYEARKRQVTLVCRKAQRSHAANAFLQVAQTAGEKA